MGSPLIRTSRFLSRAAWAVFLLIFGLTAISLLRYGNLSSLKYPALLALPAVTAGVYLLHLAGKLALRLGAGRTLILLLVICAAVKTAWVLLVPIDPVGDYETFYLTARSLMEQPVLLYPRYVSLFPHILGYSQFLAWAMTLLGTDYLVAVLLNAVLSTLSAGLLFHLGYRLSGLPLATAATLLWILFPSQTMYNMFILSEPLYTTLILAVLSLTVEIHLNTSPCRWYRSVLPGGIVGILLAAVNAVRPVAVILVIALLLWLFLLRMNDWRDRTFRVKWIPFVAALLVVWLAAGALWSGYSAARLGEEPASVPGFNVLVGLNPDSGGAWNAEDSALLDEYNNRPDATPQEIQQQLLQDAIDRATSGQIRFPSLILRKLHAFLSVDSACVQYAQDALTCHNLYGHVCNGFYYAVVLLSVLGGTVLLRRGDRSLLFLPMVYVIGLTLAQMLVEVAARYHYSILPTLCLLGGWAALWLAHVPGRLRKQS